MFEAIGSLRIYQSVYDSASEWVHWNPRALFHSLGPQAPFSTSTDDPRRAAQALLSGLAAYLETVRIESGNPALEMSTWSSWRGKGSKQRWNNWIERRDAHRPIVNLARATTLEGAIVAKRQRGQFELEHPNITRALGLVLSVGFLFDLGHLVNVTSHSNY